ncbi:restriction endonuclease subunit S [Rossellomorea marisflavi]|uniref:restriction endonuclease subunit S n=1 Tax=Rossellomorea marisflavi TaxID=189381 RepID=UPI0027A00E51|nr:restriction endonuclease subunit S [Rossellomorea marisflavi]UTE72810.1 restriction endonuclease subunit S [Rossellomorea marisflavi]
MMFHSYKLEDICEKITDGAHHSPKSVTEGYPMASVKDLTPFGIDFASCRLISSEDYAKLVGLGCQPEVNDILIAKDGNSCLETVMVQREKQEVVLLSSVAILRPNPLKVDPKYLSLYLSENRVIKDMKERLVSGSAIPRVILKAFREYEVKLPPIEIQKKISSILGTLDEKLELNNLMNQTLEEMAMTLYKHWFVDFNHFKEGEFVETELGIIPKGWDVVKLKDVAAVNKNNMKNDYPYKNIRYVDISSVFEGKLEGYSEYSLSDAPSRAKRLVNDGDIIWSTVRPNRKSFLYIYKPSSNTVVSTGFAVLSPVKIPPTFLYLHVITEQFVSYLVNNAKGSAYPAVNASTFKDAKICLPPKEVLKDFNDLVLPIINLKNENEVESANLELTRDYLLPKLLSGEIDLYKAKEEVKTC